ncbi:hypothetical protein DM02DRAFT_658370 [Periconia macrospinosa]|uniref:Spindle pole body component n=1 Tax=Periconia macrospinosa TaxID=97972 RepID=A0A2V1DGY6_9PLEO|nr:hypothetical protein DM02DRAFT_658370 [Periconia macrospinosa]
MAQNQKLSVLTDELIHSILKFDPQTNRQAYKRAKEIATKGLRAHQYNRTNQFDVQSSFNGLDEKFRVLNRDDLADALGERVKEINERQSRWIPEYLHLLLQLSDQPTENTKIEALELLRPPTPPPPLTWEQILQEDPYSDEEIWKDVDFRHDSSEDDFEDSSPRKRPAKDTPRTSVHEDDTYDPEACVIPVDDGVIEELEEAQFWREDTGDKDIRIDITEQNAIRETLFMLAGLHTSLYHLDKQNSSIRVSQKYVLTHAMQKTADHLLVQFAEMGRELYRLRKWTRKPSSLPLIQTFEAVVRDRLAAYDRSLALMQQKYLVPEAPIAVSLLALHSDLQTLSTPILRLARLVVDIEPQLLVNPFVHLETLFDNITLAQMMLETDVFNFLSRVFFESLQTYLKPISRWMGSGELGLNDETFFVFENDSGSEASSLWHDRYVLRRGHENKLRSPNFLHPAAQKIFNTGKSVIFLKELRLHHAKPNESKLRLDHESICGKTSDIPLSPFPDLFQDAFQAWIGSRHLLASSTLREHLYTSGGLMQTLNVFETLYLSANGSTFQDFADAIFERLDGRGGGWNDRFLLTELARGIFGMVLDGNHAEKIVVRSSRSKAQDKSVKRLADVGLDYALPWPIQNIIQRSSIPIYQQISTFLLQTYRMKYLTQRVSPKTIAQLRAPNLRQTGYKLRQRLIWFADILRSYLTETVIDLSTQEMKAAMIKAEDIDDMSNIHVKYVARLQEQALLSENLKPIHKAIISILDLGVVFSERCFPTASQTDPLESSTAAKSAAQPTKPASKAKSKSSRRKSFIPALAEDINDSSDSEGGDPADDKAASSTRTATTSTFEDNLKMVDKELDRLLPFVAAGLRNVGRVGAEPCWEVLAERLGWGERKPDGLER